MDVINTLKEIDLFIELEQSELEMLSKICKVTSCNEGEIIFDEDDEGGSMFVVAEGSVKISKAISQFVDKDLLVAGKGVVFGEISFIDKKPRSAKAAAGEGTVVISIGRDEFADIAGDSPAFAKIFFKLACTVADRLRLANDLLKESLVWGLEAAGGAALNLNKIISDSVNVIIDLVDGKQIEGKILKVEQSMAGYEVTIKSKENKLFLVPYHAIVRVYF